MDSLKPDRFAEYKKKLWRNEAKKTSTLRLTINHSLYRHLTTTAIHTHTHAYKSKHVSSYAHFTNFVKPTPIKHTLIRRTTQPLSFINNNHFKHYPIFN